MGENVGPPTPKIGNVGSKATLLGCLDTVLVVGRHLFVSIAFLDWQIGGNVTSSRPGSLLDHISRKLQRRRHLLGRRRCFTIVRDGEP